MDYLELRRHLDTPRAMLVMPWNDTHTEWHAPLDEDDLAEPDALIGEGPQRTGFLLCHWRDRWPGRLEIPSMLEERPGSSEEWSSWWRRCLRRFAVKDGASAEVEWSSLSDRQTELARAELVTGDLPPGELPA